MKALGVIPARAGSKGIKNKNTIQFAGLPLVEWTIKCSQASSLVDRIVCTTDCDFVKQIADKYSLDVIRRKNFLADDKAKMVDVLIDVARQECYEDYTHLVLLQTTSPCRTAALVNKCIETAFKEDCDTVITAYMDKHCHPSLIMTVGEKSAVKWILPGKQETNRQDFDKYLIRCGTCYVIKKEALLINKSIYGSDVRVVEIDKLYSPNIDEPSDILIAERNFMQLHGI